MRNKKILIVDFEEESLNSLVSFFQAKGFQIVTATDGLSGLEKFEAEKPDLVILEALLSKLHGFDLCNKITCEYDRKVPVVIVTGIYREMRFKIEALRSYGASAYFEKPYQKEELLT
ncbi:MAG: response regulator transcription factor, partial [Candidatus Methanofastidiosia archaeon]